MRERGSLASKAVNIEAGSFKSRRNFPHLGELGTERRPDAERLAELPPGHPFEFFGVLDGLDVKFRDVTVPRRLLYRAPNASQDVTSPHAESPRAMFVAISF